MALADVANLIVRLSLDDQFSGKLRSAQGSLGRMQTGFSQIGRGVGQVASGFDRLATRATLAAAGGLTAVVKTAIDFEDAWAGVEKTVNETDLSKVGLSFEKLQMQFRDMAREIPVSFEELSAIGEQAGALGIAAKDITGFTEVVAKLGVTTDLSSDQAATALGQLGSILNLTGQDFNEFADSLVNLGNQGASTESQIIAIASRFGAAGRQAGLSKEEILGFSSALASMGVREEAAGSALSRIFNQTTTNIGLANDKAKAFAKVLGEPFAEFKRSWDTNARGTFIEFLGKLRDLDKFKQAKVLKDIGITNVRDINAIQLAAQNLKLVNDQLRIAEERSGALNKEAEKRFATTRSQIQRFVNVARDIGFVVGKELLPVINDALTDLTKFLARPESQRAIKDFAKNLAQGARDLVAAFKRGEFDSVIDSLKGAAAVAKTAFDAFNALPQPIKSFLLAAIVANKATGGAIGQITGGLGNILSGGLKVLFERGRTPLAPMYVAVVNGGLGGGLPGPGGLPGTGGGGRLATTGANLLKGFIAFEVGQILADAIGHAATGQNPLDALPFIGKSTTKVGRTEWPKGVGNVKVTNQLPESVMKLTGIQIKQLNEDINRQLKRGDVLGAARNQHLLMSLHRLRGTVDDRTNRIVIRLGAVNQALSKANRNLDEGNKRQREVADRVREARERIGSGFQRSNEQLGVIARKKTSFTASVTNNITAYLSAYQSMQTMSRINTIRTAVDDRFRGSI